MTDATEPTVRYWQEIGHESNIISHHRYPGDFLDTWREVVVMTPAELDAIKAEVAEFIAQRLEAVDPIEWALAGQHAGTDAARISRTYIESED